MEYLYLGLAIVAEVFATSFLKNTEGFTRLVPSIICGCCYLVCHLTFSKAILKLNLGVSYALWCGVGILITSVVSVLIYRESLSGFSVAGLIFVAVGCILVNLG